MQRQHRELPPGFFCSLIYIKQTGELLSLEDWASGKAAPGLQQDWAQHSRQQVCVYAVVLCWVRWELHTARLLGLLRFAQTRAPIAALQWLHTWVA